MYFYREFTEELQDSIRIPNQINHNFKIQQVASQILSNMEMYFLFYIQEVLFVCFCFLLLLLLFFFFNPEFHSFDQSGSKLMVILLPQPPWLWDYRPTLPCPVSREFSLTTSSANTLFQILKFHFKNMGPVPVISLHLWKDRSQSLLCLWALGLQDLVSHSLILCGASGFPAGTPLPFLGGCLTEGSTLGGISLEHIPGQGESNLPPPFSWHVLGQPSHHELPLTSRVQGKKTFLPYGASHGKPWKTHTACIKSPGLTMWESSR